MSKEKRMIEKNNKTKKKTLKRIFSKQFKLIHDGNGIIDYTLKKKTKKKKTSH